MRWPPTLLAALITLHQPGGAIYVNPEEIMLVRACSAGWPKYCPPGTNAVVVVHDREIAVVETPAEVKRLRDGE